MNKEVMMKIDKAVDTASSWYGIDPLRMKAHCWQESAWGELGDQTTIVGSDGGGQGIFQIDKRYHKFAEDPLRFDVFLQSVYASLFLKEIFNEYGSWDKASEAYNGSGPDAVRYAENIKELMGSKPWERYLK